ncbi:glutaredoxin family protein [Halorussus sp. AFM4]|uniref:glutaredoxin family protein n=1 Tax=Halorussus sp. AFM4 TaxID=3421651 RepID=UPI003EC0DF09
MSEHTVTVYTREACHLCEDAIETVDRVADEVAADVSVETVDVDEDPELREEYGERVPYVLVDGRPQFKYRVDATSLRTVLGD